MPHDTINKAVTIVRVAAIGFTLWGEIRAIADAITLLAVLDGEEAMQARMDELDRLDPNTLQGLTWQSIKVFANEFDE